MSALPKIIEGTWEEILQHAPELAGHHLKVIVVDEDQAWHDHPAFDRSPAAVEAWVADLFDWAYNRPPLGPWDDSRAAAYGDLDP